MKLTDIWQLCPTLQACCEDKVELVGDESCVLNYVSVKAA